MISEEFPSRLLKCYFLFWRLSSWWQLLVLLLKWSSFKSLPLLSTMLNVIVYLLPNFSFGFEMFRFSFWYVSFPWTFLSFCAFTFVGFLLIRMFFHVFFSFFELQLTPIELYIWLLVRLVCTLLLLLYGFSYSFKLSFKCLLKSIKFVSYSYFIFMAYIAIVEWGLVIRWDFNCFLFRRILRNIFTQMILLSDDTPSKGAYASQKYLSTFCLCVYNLWFSVIWVGVGS